MVVGSGSGQNCHAYWFLRERVGLDVIEQVNRRLALTLGADARCSDPARILRPAGSVNRKHSPPAAVRLLKRAPTERVSLAELQGALVDEPTSRSRLAPRSRPAGISADPLDSISPRVYFERRTGQRVSGSGKARCPFHDDRTPSLHVYEDPGQGWYCFGCRRGGSAIDLAALLWHRDTRGDGFVKLRRRLEARLLSGVAAGVGTPPPVLRQTPVQSSER